MRLRGYGTNRCWFIFRGWCGDQGNGGRMGLVQLQKVQGSSQDEVSCGTPIRSPWGYVLGHRKNCREIVTHFGPHEARKSISGVVSQPW